MREPLADRVYKTLEKGMDQPVFNDFMRSVPSPRASILEPLAARLILRGLIKGV